MTRPFSIHFVRVFCWIPVALAVLNTSCQPHYPETLTMSEERRMLNFGPETELNFDWRFREIDARPVAMKAPGGPLSDLFANNVATGTESSAR